MWKNSLNEDEQNNSSATGFFSVIRRHERSTQEYPLTSYSAKKYNLSVVPFSQEYRPFLLKAASLLHKAAELTDILRYCSSPTKINFFHKKCVPLFPTMVLLFILILNH